MSLALLEPTLQSSLWEHPVDTEVQDEHVGRKATPKENEREPVQRRVWWLDLKSPL